MYLDYVKERLLKDYVETDDGFAIYSLLKEAEAVYIEDIYVKPERRRNHAATKLADQVVTVSREHGVKYVLGTVAPAAKGSTESLKVLLGYGMTLFKIENNLIWFFKEI